MCRGEERGVLEIFLFFREELFTTGVVASCSSKSSLKASGVKREEVFECCSDVVSLPLY